MLLNTPLKFRTYLLWFLAAAVLPAASGLILNTLLDPLWYGSGNQLFSQNFPFNERFSKGNLFLRNPDRYDCVILGSSRTTLLDAHRIENHRCFNFAVSNGAATEYTALLHFFMHNAEADTIILGADGFNYTEHGIPSTLPAFIENLGSPPSQLDTYLSLDVLDFSLRALVSRSQRTRYYTSEWVGDTMTQATPFPSADRIDDQDPHGGLAATETNSAGPFQPELAAIFGKIRDEFPGQHKWIGYVPPLSSEFLLHVKARGNLPGYMESIWRASQHFDVFFDFSVPSSLSSDLENTYDGSHYYRSANNQVARVLSGQSGDEALPLHALTETEYKEIFQSRLRQFETDRFPDR